MGKPGSGKSAFSFSRRNRDPDRSQWSRKIHNLKSIAGQLKPVGGVVSLDGRPRGSGRKRRLPPDGGDDDRADTAGAYDLF